MTTSPLAELAGAVRGLERLRVDCPERYQPSARVVFATLSAARADVVDATSRGKLDQALAVVADWEREAGKLITTKTLHAPLAAQDGS